MASSDANPEQPLRILAVVEWYPPAYKAGGPVRSVHNLMQLLKAQTPHHLEVVCGDRDLGSTEPLSGISSDIPTDQDGIAVTYRSTVSYAWWKAKLRGTAETPPPDVIYLNSLFSVPYALHPLRAAKSLGIRVVLAPRGMLGAGALAIKPAKKKLFLTLARLLGLFRGVRWHASTALESIEIQRQFPRAECRVAINVPLFQAESQTPIFGGGCSFLVLGRINQKKNIHFALEALQKVDFGGKELTVELMGPAEDKPYLERLLSMARPGLKVVHAGAVPPESLGEVWARCHALLMPTRHENFGHAVVEAWAHGRPVLLSDQTPWRGLAELDLGWDLPLEVDVWADHLSKALSWEQGDWARMSVACQKKHASIVGEPRLVSDNRLVFEAPFEAS
jgi:glycosyltransferase involved in cell wall biosynthesis